MQELTAQVIGVIPNLTREQAEKMQNASYLTDAIEAAENVAGFEADRVMSVFTPSEADSDLIPGVLMAARHAVLGLLAKDSIPGEYFDSLTEPWVRAVGPLTLNEVSIGEPHTPTEEEIADLGAPDDSTSDDPNATPGMREGEGFPDAPTDGSSDIADLPTSNEATDGTTDK